MVAPATCGFACASGRSCCQAVRKNFTALRHLPSRHDCLPHAGNRPSLAFNVAQALSLAPSGRRKRGGGSFPGRCPGLFSPAPLGRKTQLTETLVPARFGRAVVTGQFPTGGLQALCYSAKCRLVLVFFALALDPPTRMVSDGAKPTSCQARMSAGRVLPHAAVGFSPMIIGSATPYTPSMKAAWQVRRE